ncbi:MAG: metallophosphoesterase family protein [Gemmatimonadota bacterium]|nr:MAG: metallophosphoesterase family protein [Gemmatimonadota bacterium]
MKRKLRIGVISDTHGLLRNEVYGAFKGVDEILHAGDVGDAGILHELEVIAPVHAVYGNVDGWELRKDLPETLEMERLGRKIAMIHGHQWATPQVPDLIERFAGAAVVIFGHTHRPLVQQVGGTLVVNPGSAGHRRFSLPVSAVLLTLTTKTPPEAKILDLS